MTDHLWFRARRYGWGWEPASAEGWLVMLGFLVIVLLSVGGFYLVLRSGVRVPLATAFFVLWVLLLSGGLIAIAWHTGERPRWRWGD
jgi:hypothetical protein